MLLVFLFKVNWLLMSYWCFVGCCELCWFMHKVHCVESEDNCVESEFKVHDNLSTCKKKTIHTLCTHKQTHIIITHITE